MNKVDASGVHGLISAIVIGVVTVVCVVAYWKLTRAVNRDFEERENNNTPSEYAETEVNEDNTYNFAGFSGSSSSVSSIDTSEPARFTLEDDRLVIWQLGLPPVAIPFPGDETVDSDRQDSD